MSGLAHNLVSNVAGSSWLALVQIVFVPVYIALLGIEGDGLSGFYLTLLGMLLVLDVGLTTTMNREMARYSVRSDAADARHFARTLEVHAARVQSHRARPDRFRIRALAERPLVFVAARDPQHG